MVDSIAPAGASQVYSIVSNADIYWLPFDSITPGNTPETIAVDLGLSVKWSKINMGADHPSVNFVGSYYAWGDTDRYSSLKAAAGTINYVAPEVLEKDGETTIQADIYSLGMIMKDMHLPKRYNAVIDKAVATDRNQRLGSVEQLQEAIEMASYRSKQKKWLAIVAGAAMLLCLAAFWGGYNLNIMPHFKCSNHLQVIRQLIMGSIVPTVLR